MSYAKSILFIAALCCAPVARAVDMNLGGGVFHVPVTSVKSAQVKTTALQQFDFSCGSAALATLLTYQYGYPVNEQSVFEEMFAQGDQALIKQQGFSLLDMKRYLASHGFEADGFTQPLDKLIDAKLPAIVLVNENGYNHFVVIKGIRDGRVLIGDPAVGTKALSQAHFSDLWKTKLLFVVHNKNAMARFNASDDWKVAPAAPVGRANGQELRTSTLTKLGPGDF